MSKRPETLFELLEKYIVQVPIIQRDYAHGRKNEHASMVREILLADIKRAIEDPDSPRLDLDFVYGKPTEDGEFLPIDGQQRLTTLFLLHLYAFHDDESATVLLRKFTYETRISSRDFFKKLIENRKTVFSSSLAPSEEIKDSAWFRMVWINDPTIESALVMLDDIKEEFVEVRDLAQKLLHNNPPITFNFLDMPKLGMEDDMYIKLNARGKPLTEFESLKAQLIDRLRVLELDEKFEKKFVENLDGKWTDLFWKYKQKSFDQSYFEFFRVLLMNKDLWPNDKENKSSTPVYKNRMGASNYKEIGPEIFETANFTLNFLCEKPGAENPERKELVEKVHQHIFSCLEDPTYRNRVLFHAVTTYMWMAKGKGIDNASLFQWIRIIKNLVLNSRIGDHASYGRARNRINELKVHWNNLLEFYAREDEDEDDDEAEKTSGFSGKQIREEKQKARIIRRGESSEFETAIYKAEEHPYFEGQIRSALNYGKDDNDKPDLKLFEKYWAKISALFDKDNTDKPKPVYGDSLRQALLTYGDYTIKISNDKTLCINDADGSTPSMKRLFSRDDPRAEDNDPVKDFLDALDINENIESQLKSIIANSKVPKNNWRHCFIRFPILFTKMSQSQLRLREVVGETMIVIPSVYWVGSAREIFSLALQEALNEHKIQAVYSENLEPGENTSRLEVNGLSIFFKDGKFTIYDKTKDIEEKYITESNDPLAEATEYVLILASGQICR